MTRKFKGHQVSLTENARIELGWSEVKTFPIYWEASLDARDFGSPDVTMSRTGLTAAEAYDNLRKAVEEQGWELP